MQAGTATAPRRQQTMDALAMANRRRQDHKNLKWEIASGAVTAKAAFADPRAIGAFTVGNLLIAQRGWGERKAIRFLMAIGATSAVLVKPVDKLTERQRDILLRALDRPFAVPVDGDVW
jgi:hypothetical protein